MAQTTIRNITTPFTNQTLFVSFVERISKLKAPLDAMLLTFIHPRINDRINVIYVRKDFLIAGIYQLMWKGTIRETEHLLVEPVGVKELLHFPKFGKDMRNVIII